MYSGTTLLRSAISLSRLLKYMAIHQYKLYMGSIHKRRPSFSGMEGESQKCESNVVRYKKKITEIGKGSLKNLLKKWSSFMNDAILTIYCVYEPWEARWCCKYGLFWIKIIHRCCMFWWLRNENELRTLRTS